MAPVAGSAVVSAVRAAALAVAREAELAAAEAVEAVAPGRRCPSAA